MRTIGGKMKKIQSFGAVVLVIFVAISNLGAHADEKSNGVNNGKSNNSVQEFKGVGSRSHGHPIANLTEAPVSGSVRDNKPYVSDDDPSAEMNWQIWNKANDKAAAKTIGTTAVNPIGFHAGGAIGLYTGQIQIIPVWVGGWTIDNKAFWNSRLMALVSGLSGVVISTPNQVFNTDTLYFTLRTAQPSKLLWPTSVASTTVPASLQTAINGVVPVSDANVVTYINSALVSGKIAGPTAGMRALYVYIGAADTRLSSGFGTSYCGWHTYGTLGANNIPYIAIQDFTSKYYSACSAQTISPNGNIALDAMASVLVHEIDEAITDADLRTWYDANGAENADKCAWTFAPFQLDAGGFKYNFSVGGYKYLIQRNWLANNLVTDTVARTACSLLG